jgi:hypothetical protein
MKLRSDLVSAAVIELSEQRVDAQAESTPQIVDCFGLDGHDNCVIAGESRLVTGTNTRQEVGGHG